MLPLALGTGADCSIIENAPKGIVISAALPVGAGAGTGGVASEEAPGVWIATRGVGVGITGLLGVTKLSGLTSGVTVVEARGPGDVNVDDISGAEGDSDVSETVVTMVIGRLIVSVSAVSPDGVTEDSIDCANGVSGAAGAGSLIGTVVIIVVVI